MGVRNLTTVFFGLFLLLCGVIVTLYGVWSRGQTAFHANLLSGLPAEVPGWEVKDMPIASSAEMQKAVNEMLNFDQAVFREYRSGGRSLTIYVAYWAPYRFHPRLISIHTPDVCWVSNGFVLRDADYKYAVLLSQKQSAWHAQRRVFATHGQDIHVLYWHILDGRLSGYAEGPQSRDQSFFVNFINDMTHGAGEQFFIRISSPQPWSEWVNDPLYNKILNVLSPVLLAKG